MKLSFLESGMDSLKKGFSYLIEYEKLYYNTDAKRKPKQRLFHLKDAILFIQHGTEILLKSILSKHSEYLLFTNIDSNVKKAFTDKKSKKLKSVFESDLKHKIHTVSYIEAIERVKILPNVILSKTLEKKLLELEVFRNIIVHSEPFLNEDEINNTLDDMANQLDVFFFKTIGHKYKTISGYSEFVKNFEKFQNVLKEKNLILKAQTNELIFKSLHTANLTIGEHEIKRYTDIISCTKFIDSIFNSDLRFGTDLYNGYCSGDIKMRRASEELFHIIFLDKDLIIEFKLKSLILIMPKIEGKSSPIVLIESDEFEESNEELNKCKKDDYQGVSTLEYLKLENDSFVVGYEKVYDFYENNIVKKHSHHMRFYTKGIVCFFNVQGLNYNHALKYIIKKNIGYSIGKDLEVALRDIIDHL